MVLQNALEKGKALLTPVWKRYCANTCRSDKTQKQPSQQKSARRNGFEANAIAINASQTVTAEPVLMLCISY